MASDPRFSAEPPPYREGMSAGSKILLGTGIGCGMVCLLCCGGFVFLGFVAYRTVEKAVVQDPAEVRAVLAELATIEIPPNLEPQGAVNAVVPFINKPLFKGVLYADEAHDEQAMVLGEVLVGTIDEKQIRREIDNALSRKTDDDDDFKVRETHDLDLEIRGKPARFRIEQGETKDDRKMVRAFGEFSGHTGAAVLFLQLDAEEYPPEKVEEILRSIR